MELFVSTFFNILILSSMYILTALGFAFLFNMLGILNLAHGSVYMLGAYVGYFFIFVIGLSHWVGLLFTILILGLFGLLLERFCFRPFVEDFNRTIMACVAVVVALQTTVTIIVGDKTMAIPTFVEGVLRVGPLRVSYERLLIFAVGALLLAAVVFLVNRTRVGYQMQAISQHRLGAFLQGIDIHRVSAFASALGCVLAAIAGCFMGSYLRLSPYMGDLMLVKVLIIVMLAGIGSMGGILVTGLILGVLSAVLPVFMSGAASEATIIIAVVILLLLRPEGFFGRELLEGHEFKDISGEKALLVSEIPDSVKDATVRKVLFAVFLCALMVLPVLIGSPYVLHILILTFIYIVASVSLRAITISGQFPLAHGAFMGIGAYLAGMAAKHLGWPPSLTIPCAALMTAIIGMLTGYPFVRLRALYYAMGSLFFGIGVVYIVQAGGSWTGGYSGFPGIPPIFGASKMKCYYFFLGLLLASLFALHRFEFSRVGLILKAMAQSYLAASSVGINEVRYRILALGVGCFFVGLAGAGYAHYTMVLSPSSFNFMATLWLVMYALIGGMGNFAGPVVGTAVLLLLPEFVRSLKEYSPFVSAALLFVVAYALPGGLVSVPQVARALYFRYREDRRIVDASGS